jgi:hypothetical protein
MAKLKAYGRSEVARYVRERTIIPDPSDPAPIVWERVTRALMSDRKVLQKRDVRWLDGMRHTYGWSVRGKLARHATFESVGFLYERMGYVRVAS